MIAYNKFRRGIFFFFLFSSTLYAQNNTAIFETYMQKQSNLYRFNGNVLVSKNGEVVYKKSFGYSDFDTKIKLNSNSIFDCGSIAKEFTAMGILMLKDRGLIQYNDTLRHFFPELPYTNITIFHLLTHTSGMPDGYDLIEKYFDHDKIATNQDLIQLLAKEKPEVLFKPGENLMYSGTAFNLLASIIEKISGQSYNTYLEENIFKPLGMEHTQVANFPRNINNTPLLAKGYIYDGKTKKYQTAESVYPQWTSYFTGVTGEGMIITTTGDLLKWDRALKNNKLLNASTQLEMCTAQAEKKTIPAMKFGFGMRVESDHLGKCVFHNGWYPGFKCMHIRYTDEDITVIVLSNNQSESSPIADGLACIALNQKLTMPYFHKAINILTPLNAYAGKYMMPLIRPPYMVNFSVEIIAQNDSLFLHNPSVADVQLIPESETKFFYGNDTDQQLEFEKDSLGNITKVYYLGYGVKKEIKKID